MKKFLFELVLVMALAMPTAARADLVYTYDANVSGFDDENVFTHDFSLGQVQEILSVSIDLIHTRATDIDFFLRTPTGQNFVLTTDNGSTSDLNGTYTFVNVFGPNGGNGLWTNLGPSTPIPSGFYDAESWVTRASGWNPGTWRLTLNDDLAGESGSVGTVTVTYSTSVPEPAAGFILATGGGLWVMIRRRR